MNKLYIILFLIIGIYTQNIYSYTIYIIRHGEKINDDHIGLSKKGKKRANEIKRIFSNSKFNIKYLYAQQYDDDGHKKRPYLTLKPLSKKMNLKIDTTCKREDIKCIIDKILNNHNDGNILLTWEHDKLQKIAEKLINELKIKGNNLKNKLDKSNDGYDFLWKFKNNKLEIIKNYIKKENI